MKSVSRAAGVLAACVLAAPVAAQLAPGPAPDAPVLRVGTKVPLKLDEELTTKGKMLRVGQRFNLETSEAVMVNGAVVIPAGSPAVGEVTEVRNKGMWGKSGHLTAQVLYVTVNGRQVRLNGTFDDKGVAGTGAVVGAIATVPIAGFFVTGTSARVPLGSPVMAFVGEDVPVAVAAAPVAPLQALPATMPVVSTAPASVVNAAVVTPVK